MNKNNKGNQSPSAILSSIEEKLEILKKDNQISDNASIPELQVKINLTNSLIPEIQENFNLVKKSINGIKILCLYLIILLLITTGLAIGFGIYSGKLQNSNDAIQTSVQKVYEENYRRDSVLDNIMNIKYDSMGYPSYFYSIKSGKIVTYNDLLSLRDSLNIYKDLVSQIRDLYPIEANYKIIKVKKGYETQLHVGSPKIDSALMLLPYFRKNLSRDSSGFWQINTTK